MVNPDPSFWSRQRVFLTGHTGFKGAWLTLWLQHLGAKVFGLALPPDTLPNLFDILQPLPLLNSDFGDIRDLAIVKDAVRNANPTLAIHMAAQPLVRRSYREPLDTFATNIMGTGNVMEALRASADLKAILAITTDKVYANHGEERAFVENDRLGGEDPYSASKAGAELAVQCWVFSFFKNTGVKIATVRAGNVIGGGDWSEDRLVPDVWRAVHANVPPKLRYPDATRPWQHVLDALHGYLLYAQMLGNDGGNIPTALNIGPLPNDTLKVCEVVDTLLAAFGAGFGWDYDKPTEMVEMKYLALDPTLAIERLGWKPRLTAREALAWSVEWYRAFDQRADARGLALDQIKRYQLLNSE